MLDFIKAELIKLLRDRDVSLAFIYNSQRQILWQYGRSINGKNINHASSIPHSIINKSIINKTQFIGENTFVNLKDNQLSHSAHRLNIKHILIYPVENLYLYIDSGYQMKFSESELGQIELITRLFVEFIKTVTLQPQGLKKISGTSPSVNRLRELILKYSIEEDSVLLLGETGVGKSHIAELIHQFSGRNGNFVAVNTATLSEELLESAIFGHKKGAFTGAVCDKRGFVDLAEGGTLFLDEICEIPISFQAKLLRFIETMKYHVVGDPVEKKGDIRLIAATNQDPLRMIEEKTFREDLFYRLNILSITIPPLRVRKEDIRTIVEENLKFLKGKDIDDSFYAELLNHHWPGNIRELLTIIKRAGILCSSPIKGEDVKPFIHKNSLISKPIANMDKTSQIWEQFKQGKNFWEVIKEPFLNRDLSRDEVKDILQTALNKTGNKYINTMELFNLNKKEYNIFIRFLYRNNLQ